MLNRLFTILIFTGISPTLYTQPDFNGLWVGYNTQDDQSSYSSKYDFEIYLHQKDDQIQGRSYATIDSLYAEMIIQGKWDGRYLHLQEVEVVRQQADDGMEWCIKSCRLQLIYDDDGYFLEGSWTGSTSFSTCIPGRVYLKKVPPRA